MVFMKYLQHFPGNLWMCANLSKKQAVDWSFQFKLIKWWVSISPKSLLVIGINPFKVCVTHSETQTTPSADTLFTSKKRDKTPVLRCELGTVKK